MNLQPELQALFDEYEPQITTFLWPSEDDRWAELVFCLLQEFDGIDAPGAREAVAVLQYLNALNVDDLAFSAKEGEATSVSHPVIVAVFERSGLTADDARAATDLIGGIAQVLAWKFDGKLQRFLRAHADNMVQELTELFEHPSLSEEALRNATTLWLQNAANMPILMASSRVQQFLNEHEATVDDAVAAADVLDINVAIVDDLLLLAAEDHAGGDGARPDRNEAATARDQ